VLVFAVGSEHSQHSWSAPRPMCQHADTHTLFRPFASWPACLPRLRQPCAWSEPGAAHVTGEAFVSTVSSREACIDAVAAAPTATCPEPKIANMPAALSGSMPCYCQTGTDTTPGPVCAAAAAARRLPALRWPCCLVCACVLGSVPRLLTDALAPSVSPRTPPCPVSRSYLTVRQLLLPHRGKPPASSACSSVRSGPNGFAIGQLPGLSGWKVQTCGWRPGVHGLRTSLNHRLRQEHRQNRLPVQCWILGPQRRPMHRVRHREIQGRRRGYRVQ